MSSTPEQRQARLLLSERFLDEVMLPTIRDGIKFDVVKLYRAFQRLHAGIGSDFELSHVYIHAFERDLHNEYLAEHHPERLPFDAADIVVAVALLEEVAFKEIPQ